MPQTVYNGFGEAKMVGQHCFPSIKQQQLNQQMQQTKNFKTISGQVGRGSADGAGLGEGAGAAGIAEPDQDLEPEHHLQPEHVQLPEALEPGVEASPASKKKMMSGYDFNWTDCSLSAP